MLVTKWWARDTSYFFLIFFYLRLLWVFIAAWGLSLVLASFLWGLHSGCGAWAPHCGGFSCCRAQALGHKGFKRGGTKVWLFQGMWNLPRPGIKLCLLHEPGRFLATGPPGKSLSDAFWKANDDWWWVSYLNVSGPNVPCKLWWVGSSWKKEYIF